MNKNFAVIFDMDGVMINNNQYHKKAWRAFVEKYGFNLSEDQLKEHVYGKTNRDILQHLFGANLADQDIQKYAEEKEEMYRSLYKNKIQSTEGLLTLLDNLSSNNIPVAVATSAPPKNVDFVLSSIDAKKYFDIIVDETDVKKGKPDPEIYLTTAQKLRINPSDCIVFEDSLSGVQSALHAHMSVIAITTTHTKDELSHANHVIDDFTQINTKKLSGLISSKSN